MSNSGETDLANVRTGIKEKRVPRVLGLTNLVTLLTAFFKSVLRRCAPTESLPYWKKIATQRGSHHGESIVHTVRVEAYLVGAVDVQSVAEIAARQAARLMPIRHWPSPEAFATKTTDRLACPHRQTLNGLG